MTTPQEFLSEFVKDIIKHPGDRPKLIAGWAKHMEAREQSVRVEMYERFMLEVTAMVSAAIQQRSSADPYEELGHIVRAAAKKAAGLE